MLQNSEKKIKDKSMQERFLSLTSLNFHSHSIIIMFLTITFGVCTLKKHAEHSPPDLAQARISGLIL